MTPRITLRPSELDYLRQSGPVTVVKVYVAEEDWEPFLAIARQGMEIPVLVEGGDAEAAFLLEADFENKAITVVI